jgi:hypothetical protein
MNLSVPCFLLLCTVLEGGGQAQSPLAKVTGGGNEQLPALLAASRSKPVYTKPALPTPTQRFVCNTGYTQKLCTEQMTTLRKTLGRYPVAKLGDWTWVLVRSEDWKTIIASRGLDPGTAAFTYPPKHETFIEEALVSPVPERQRELLLKWNMGRVDLLDFAIRHEMGHALCNDPSEQNANRVAQLLQSGATISCGAPN